MQIGIRKEEIMRVSPISNSQVNLNKKSNPNFSGKTFVQPTGAFAELLRNNERAQQTVGLLEERVKNSTGKSLLLLIEDMPPEDAKWHRADIGPEIEDVPENIRISFVDPKHNISSSIGAYFNTEIYPSVNFSILWSALNKKAPNIFRT